MAIYKLPKPLDGMRVEQYLYLELMHILVEENILTEEKAANRYIGRFGFEGVEEVQNA